jgi:hypothetical protein
LYLEPDKNLKQKLKKIALINNFSSDMSYVNQKFPLQGVRGLGLQMRIAPEQLNSNSQ